MNTLLSIIAFLYTSVDFISTATIYSCDPTKSCGCSTPSTIVNSRIIGGEIAPNHTWGWMVSLQISTVHLCGASLLSSEYAITAASCLKDYRNQILSLSIFVGTNYLDDVDSTTAQRRAIIKLTTHPNYNTNSSVNNIAILQFSPLIVRSGSDLAFICLLTAYVDPFQIGSDLVAIGWGYVVNFFVSASNELRQVTVQVASSALEGCTANGFKDSNSQFCAGVIADGKDTCVEDDGGPLMAFINNTWILAGIISQHHSCAEQGYVGVYTRVSSFISFINSNTNNLGLLTTVPSSTTSGSKGIIKNVMDTSQFIFIVWFSLFFAFSY